MIDRVYAGYWGDNDNRKMKMSVNNDFLCGAADNRSIYKTVERGIRRGWKWVIWVS